MVEGTVFDNIILRDYILVDDKFYKSSVLSYDVIGTLLYCRAHSKYI